MHAERSKCESLYSPEKLLQLVNADAHTPEVFDIRLRLKSEIAKRVSRIDINFKDSKPEMATITLVNGFKDFILFQ